MFYVKDGVYPYTVTDFRIANPGISMRANPEPEALAEFGIFPVTPSPQPSFDPITQDCTRSAELRDGDWVEVWTVTDAPDAPERLRTHRDNMEVDAGRFMEALLNADLLDAAEAALAAVTPAKQRRRLQIRWQRAATFRRKSHLIAALKLTDEQLDALFEAAAKL